MTAAARGRTILAIDQGTTNTKALLVDGATGARPGDRLARDRRPVPRGRLGRAGRRRDLGGHPGGRRGLPRRRRRGRQRRDRRRRRLQPARVRRRVEPVDRRAARRRCSAGRTPAPRPRAPTLVAAGLGGEVRRRTGLSLDPMYSAPKMRWLLDAALAGGADPGDVCLGTVDAWLVWNLTGGAVFATEAGNASRTLLLDLERSTGRRPCSRRSACPARRCPRSGRPTPASAPPPRTGPAGRRPGRRRARRLPRRALPARLHDARARARPPTAPARRS